MHMCRNRRLNNVDSLQVFRTWHCISWKSYFMQMVDNSFVIFHGIYSFSCLGRWGIEGICNPIIDMQYFGTRSFGTVAHGLWALLSKTVSSRKLSMRTFWPRSIVAELHTYHMIFHPIWQYCEYLYGRFPIRVFKPLIPTKNFFNPVIPIVYVGNREQCRISFFLCMTGNEFTQFPRMYFVLLGIT